MLILYWTIPLAAIIWLALWINQFYDRPIDMVQSWLLAATVVTLSTYVFDKRVAVINGHREKKNKNTLLRIPENVLLLLTLIGGTIGALFGIFLFDHKTVKASFQIKFWLTIVLQILLLYAYFYAYQGDF